MNIEQARFNMIEQQIRPWDVLDTHVLDVIQAVPREAFVAESHRSLAFVDMEIPIGHDQIMMSPKVEARMLQALQVSSSDCALEIGTGSGFITACLAKMAKQVTTCEFFEDLSSFAQKRVQEQQLTNVDFLVDDVFNPLNKLNTYDVIAITGSTPDEVQAFSSLLKENGRLFCVIGRQPAMSATLITCVGQGIYRKEKLFETDLPYLLSTSNETTFTF